MPQSNRIILTDVDGVLLEWENHFIQWMLKRSHFVRGKRRQTYKLLPNKEREYAMEKRFGITPTTVQKEIREFNRSAWMATQPPLPEAVTYVKLLHAEGWTFIPITSQTSDVPAQIWLLFLKGFLGYGRRNQIYFAYGIGYIRAADGK